MRRIPLLVVFGMSAGNVGCQHPLDVDLSDLPLVTTDRVEYVAEAGGDRLKFDVAFVFTNRTEATLTIRSGCWSPAIERRDGEEWLPVQGGGSCLDVLLSDVVLNPGEFFSDTVGAGVSRDLGNEALRLQFEVTESGRDVPAGLRTSNVFRVVP
tara:strand:+ start:139 stop:600 length:462 start_codon:yes stop_codon:yes gene_type:complete